jgi:hypothetical protein
MPRKKDTEPKDEALEPEDEGADDATAEDDLLPEAPARARGGSGGVWAIMLVIVVLALVVTAVLYVKDRREKADAARKLQREQVMGQLEPAKSNIARAAERIQADPPDVAGAIQALNRAAEQVGELASSPRANEAGAAEQLVALQSQLRDASTNLKSHNDRYVKELRTAALAEVEPLANRVDLLKRNAQGDVDTPLVVPGVSPLPSGEEPAAEPAPAGSAAPAAEPAPTAAPETEATKSSP